MRIAVSLVLLLAASGFVYLAVRGIDDQRLARAHQLAGVLSLVLSLLLAVNPFGWFSGSNSPSSSQTATANYGGIVVIQRSNGSVSIGDTSTSAEKRYQTALALVGPEYLQALSNRISEMDTVASLEPTLFWDQQRPNETSLAYQERARAEFDRYIGQIADGTGLFPVDTTVFRARQVDLGRDPIVATHVSDRYAHLDSAHAAFTDSVGLIAGLRHDRAIRR